MIILRSIRWPQRDAIKRPFIVKQEFNKNILHSLISFYNWPKAYRFYFVKRISQYTRYTSFSGSRHNCTFLNVGRSIYKFSRMSRYKTKYFASWGYITGIRRSSF